ncbi:hypothetical protein [Sorangium sp. So ce426]|uniref:hypothetical protein n=1 Tax=Sorangium sp. So ce426 TaxID=3133312 RepID=UPI003F5C33DC
MSYSDDLPPGWISVIASHVSEVRLGRQRSPDKVAGDYLRPYLRAANVTWNGLELSDIKKMNFEPREFETYRLHPGDVLLSEASGSASEVGKPAIWRGEIDGACFQNTLIRIRSQMPLPEYLYYHFLNDARSGRFADAGKGIGINHLGADRISNWVLRLAPLAEQHRIVNKLDELTSRNRRAKEALDAIPALLERFRQSVLAAAFRGDLTADWREKNPDVEPAEELLKRIRAERRRRWEEAELVKMRAKGKVPGDDRWKEKYEEPAAVDASELLELPEGWCWTSIDEVSSCERPICYGVVQPGDEDERGVPLVRVCDLESGTVLTSQLRTINATVDAEYSRSRLQGGEVLVSVVGTIGRVAVAPPDTAGANIARAVARIVADAVPAGWLASWLSSTTMQHRLNLDAREVARKTLNIDTLRKCAVPVGPRGEMDVVVERVRSLQLWTQKVETAVHPARAAQDLLDRAILAKAFRGELVPQDSNDEPASVVLERLRAEREQNGKTTNGVGRRRTAASPPPAPSDPTVPGRKPHASRRSQAPARSRG